MNLGEHLLLKTGKIFRVNPWKNCDKNSFSGEILLIDFFFTQLYQQISGSKTFTAESSIIQLKCFIIDSNPN